MVSASGFCKLFSDHHVSLIFAELIGQGLLYSTIQWTTFPTHQSWHQNIRSCNSFTERRLLSSLCFYRMHCNRFRLRFRKIWLIFIDVRRGSSIMCCILCICCHGYCCHDYYWNVLLEDVFELDILTTFGFLGSLYFVNMDAMC